MLKILVASFLLFSVCALGEERAKGGEKCRCKETPRFYGNYNTNAEQCEAMCAAVKENN